MNRGNVLKRVHNYLGKFEVLFSTIVFTLMLADVLASIIMRKFLQVPFPWGEELARYLMVAGIMSGLGICARRNSHIAVDLFRNMLPKIPRKIVEFVADMLSLGCYVLLFSFTIIFISANSGLGQVTASLHLPIYYIYYLLLLGFGMSLIEYLYIIVDTYIMRKSSIRHTDEIIKEGE